MTDRPRTPKLSMQIECLFRHFPILCHICKERILWDEPRDWDHVIEWADNHKHGAIDIKPVHPKPCHKIKSAKSEAQRHHIDRLEKTLHGKPKRKRPKRKLKSRGFDKTLSRKLNGMTEARR